MQTRAEQRGDQWILNGRKMWITNGAEAQIYVVFANANPAAGYKGITAFVVERGFKGFSVGKKEDKLGIRASSTTELILDDVEVPGGQRARPRGPGLQGRDRDAQRRTHRHRRADDRRRRRRAARGHGVRARNARSSERSSPSSRESSSSSRRRARSSRRRGSWCTTRRD